MSLHQKYTLVHAHLHPYNIEGGIIFTCGMFVFMLDDFIHNEWKKAFFNREFENAEFHRSLSFICLN